MDLYYNVKLKGCDDSNQIIVELSNREAQALARVANTLNAKSTSNCEPRMAVWLVGDPEPQTEVDGA